MPTLKQLTCTLEFAPKNLKLREYAPKYGDGFVTTYVAVPNTSENFSVHLTSSGYIAPGLAMFVFMDGVRQCNRSRCDLVIPRDNSGAKVGKETEVDFRVRQKEDRLGKGRYIGREWTFAQLSTVAAGEFTQTDKEAMHNIGTIEVVVLRCAGYAESPRGGYIVPERRTTGMKAVGFKAPTGYDGANESRSTYGDSSDSDESQGFGLDGPWDYEDHRYYDHEHYPHRPSYHRTRRQSYREEHHRPGPSNAPHCTCPRCSRPRVENDYRPRLPYEGELGHRFRPYAEEAYRPLHILSEHQPHHQHIAPENEDQIDGDVFRRWPRNKWFPEFHSDIRRSTGHREQSQRARFDAEERHHSHRSHQKEPSAPGISPDAQKLMDEYLEKQRKLNPWFPGMKITAPIPEDKDKAVGDDTKSKHSHRSKYSHKSNHTNKSKARSIKDDNRETGAWGFDTGVHADNKSSSSSSEHDDAGGYNNADPAPVTYTGESNWDVPPANNGAWDTAAAAVDNAAELQHVERRPEEAKREKPASVKAHKSKPFDPQKPHVKPYWSNWNSKSNASEQHDHTHPLYIVPEEPLLKVPEKLVEKKHVSHQVQAGKGVIYHHTAAKPKYIDSMDKPYAVFVFKYRSKEVLEKKLGIKVKENREDYRQRMEGLTKEEIIEQLMRAKAQAGYSSDESISDNTDTEDSDSDLSSDYDIGEKNKAKTHEGQAPEEIQKTPRLENSGKKEEKEIPPEKKEATVEAKADAPAWDTAAAVDRPTAGDGQW